MMTRHSGMACLLIAMTMAAVLPSGPSLAQVSTIPAPAMGTTSPLASPGGTGIPLGAVELDPGGMSPLNSMGSATCSDVGMPGSGTAGSTSTFDGGGMGATLSGTCGSTASAISSSGTSAALPTAAGSSPGKVGIPLGSTDLTDSGTSPVLVVPVPTAPTLGQAALTAPTPSLPAPPTYPQLSASTGTSGLGTTCGSTGAAGTIGTSTASGC